MNGLNPQRLKAEDLFLTTSELRDVSIDEFYETIQTNLPKSIDLTYSLIHHQQSIDIILHLWEIRLLLILFNNKLNQAKQEAINLNNVLYLNENNNVPPPKPQVIYPLPKNNNGEISHNLLILLLRLKSVPNLSLINDFYKLCYQLRLKEHSKLISKNLINLSFDIMVILIINKNYYTLMNFLDSLLNEVDDAVVKNNLKIIKIIIDVLTMISNNTPKESIDKIIREKYSDIEIDDSAKLTLVYILRNINAVYSVENDQSLDISVDDLTLEKLIELCLNGNISGRIICCTFGLWDLQNVYDFKLLNEDGNLKFISNIETKSEPTLEDCFEKVRLQWCDNLQRVYGLE
ncbi:hypothetical protein CLIB1444_12S03158 [[Candida] jaroonii]|uniref:Uncharacterized protein n=1 Tax=[Candida] jaroonii TaxID=467808 RepID=A0ACA9YDA0_9ASCO|nr:hypothetical protein CLIB1444_12S03158 [[Candida] jaroonii]